MTEHLEAIVFDYGGVFTIPDSLRPEFELYERALGLPAGALLQALGSGPAWEAVSVGAISEEEYWRQAAGEWEKQLPPAFGRFRHGTLPLETINKEMVELAKRLHGQVRLGLLSNATVSLREHLERLGWPAHLFDVIGISAEIGRRKPDAGAFQWIAEQLGVPIGRILFVDDKPRNVEAARAAGMRALLFTTAGELAEHLRALGLRV
ncbi:MAG: HAD family hydrolase [Anaerolineae bacterium]